MMKKVIFVCLLSLSVCFSEPNAPNATTQAPAEGLKPNAIVTNKNPTEPTPEHTPTSTIETANPPVVIPPGNQNITASNAANQTGVDSNTTSSISNETKLVEKNDTAEGKPSTITVKPVDPAKTNNGTNPGGNNNAANNGTNADSKDGKKNETTTPKGEIVNPTVAPVQAKSRAFDGPSFIGGIILTLGLLAIGFMGFKYYKNQTERNYHTL